MSLEENRKEKTEKKIWVSREAPDSLGASKNNHLSTSDFWVYKAVGSFRGKDLLSKSAIRDKKSLLGSLTGLQL